MYNIKRSLAELCNGSTTDSDSVCWGSNPYSAAKKTDHDFMVCFSLYYICMVAKKELTENPSEAIFGRDSGYLS